MAWSRASTPQIWLFYLTISLLTVLAIHFLRRRGVPDVLPPAVPHRFAIASTGLIIRSPQRRLPADYLLVALSLAYTVDGLTRTCFLQPGLLLEALAVEFCIPVERRRLDRFPLLRSLYFGSQNGI